MNLLDSNLLFASIAITAILFVLVAYFTRASLKRSLGALLSAIPVIPLVLTFDSIAAHLGWWHYPAFPTSHAPLAWYIAAAIGYGAALGLIGWRVIRRWSTPGLVLFIILFASFGVVRDYGYSVTTQIIIFGQGVLPWLADLFAYASAALLVQALMRWIIGPAQADRLARMPKASI